MITYIKGKVDQIFDSSVFIENNGIGYQIFLSSKTISKLPKEGEVKIFTYMNVKEDSLSLFGFLSIEELNMFNLLLNVSGVGPKVAISMLSDLTPNQIMIAIITDDYATLSTCNGVGKKTSQRISLELKDKIKNTTLIDTPQQSIYVSSNEKQDAIDALSALGYSRSESMKAVMEIAVEKMTTEQILKLALRKLSSI